MKKYIFTFFALALSFSYWNSVHADCNNTCSIEDGPAPVLTWYITNISVLRDNLVSALWEIEESEDLGVWVQREARAVGQRVLRAMNSVLNFWDYYGSFEFRISLWITNEIPQQITRDYESLTKITEQMTRILQKSAKNASMWSTIENVCDWVLNCDMNWFTAEDILGEIIRNNNKIIQLYQASILEKPVLNPEWWYILVADDFLWEIQKLYNSDTLAWCSSCEWNSWDEFNKSISEISIKNSDYEAGVETWKQAWKQLQWIFSPSPADTSRERQLLSEYLDSQWLHNSQGDIILWNFDRYNEWWLSSSDPLTNSSNYAQVNIESEIDSFSQTLSEKFAGEEKVSIVELTRVNAQTKESSEIESEISALYDDQVPFSYSQDSVAIEIQSRIIRMHFSLLKSINMLEKYKSRSTQACEKAWPEWRCDYGR